MRGPHVERNACEYKRLARRRRIVLGVSLALLPAMLLIPVAYLGSTAIAYVAIFGVVQFWLAARQVHIYWRDVKERREGGPGAPS